MFGFLDTYKDRDTITLKDKVKHTKFYFGDISEIEGKTLKVLEKAVDDSSYMCITNKGLVDVDIRDIEE